MKKVFNSILAAVFVFSLGAAARAQRTATVSDPQQPRSPAPAGTVNAPKPPPAPATVKAKFEGGVIGYKKSEGTINFDDANQRLLFRDKKGAELFSVSYEIVNAAWADSRSQRSTAGTVVASTVPFGGLPAMLMNSTRRYLILQYRDPDTRAEGTASFKFDDKETLASVLYTFAEKAGLTQRGDAFVRRNGPTVRTNISND